MSCFALDKELGLINELLRYIFFFEVLNFVSII